ncbi:MAG: SURF1 family protein [Pseudomonadota bacterium]
MSAQRRVRLRSVLVTLAAVAGIAATALLGRWQLSRAAQKEAVFAATVQRGALPVLDGRALQSALGGLPLDPAANPTAATAATATLEPLVHRQVLLRGHWLPRFTTYLDNRQMDGKQGFYVTTPLQLDAVEVAGGAGGAGGGEGALVVLVQRGWVPRNFEDRARLVPVETPDGPVEVAGHLAASPARLYEFGHGAGDRTAGAAGAPSEGSSVIRQNLDLAAYRRETGLPLAALSVLQSGAASEGLQRDWLPITAGVETNYGYAFQWFGLCALIVILYVWFQLLRPRKRA